MFKSTLTLPTFVLLMAVAPHSIFAFDKVYSPNITKGEMEVEYSGSRTFDKNPDKNNAQGHEIELAYAFTHYFKLELNGAFEKPPGESLKFVGTGVGSVFQFFDKGQYWLDSGLLVSYNRAVRPSDNPDSIEVKLLLEKQWGSFLHRANIGFNHEVGANNNSSPERVFLWNSRYRYNVHFEPGFEIQSNFGRASEKLNFNEQEHYIGPAIFGQITHGLKYEAAYYFGTTNGSSKGGARFKLEFEKHF